MSFQVPLILRGEVIEESMVEFGGRGGGVSFRAPDVGQYLGRLPARPSSLGDLYSISFEQILDYLEELGRRLDFTTNPHLKAALDLSIRTSGLGEGILRACYENLGKVFDRKQMREMADILIGIPFLEGWVNTRSDGGTKTYVRA
ncbi:MAG TPA: hypothetical protein VKS60_18900, partial [Stellaceae bacterium]|nr:hypothetical protein [Stellaceae bacterium]